MLEHKFKKKNVKSIQHQIRSLKTDLHGKIAERLTKEYTAFLHHIW